jgi:hypothetical protein
MARHEQFSVNALTVGTINGSVYPGAPGTGNVYYVQNTSDTDAYNLLHQRYGGVYYEDGSKVLWPCTAADADVAIQAALDACVANRNDYVLVMSSASDYDLTAVLTMSKKSVHLISPAGLGLDCGGKNATRLHQTADAGCINVTGANCEVAGFYFKNYNNKPTIYGGASGADCLHVHHNHFNLNATTTSGVPAVDCSTASGASFITIENNTFATNVSTLTFSSIISVSPSCTWAKVNGNNIMIGDGCTAVIGIYNGSYKGQTNDNTISGLAGGGGETGSITTAITIGGGVAIGNRIATANTADCSGGGTYSWLLTYSGATGGALVAH